MPSITGKLTASGDSAALIDITTPQGIEVWSYSVMGRASDIDVTIKTGVTVKATILCPAGGVGGMSAAGAKNPLFVGLPGEDLKINLSGTGEVAYNIEYSIYG